MNKNKLYKAYCINKLSAAKIAKKYNLSIHQVYRKLRKHNIKRRTQIEAGQYKMTDKIKKIISIKNKGKKATKTSFKKGHLSPNKGSHLSQKTKTKISKKAAERYKLKKYRKILAKASRKGIKVKLANKKKLFKKCEFCKCKYCAGWKENKNSYKRRFCSKKCAYDYSRFDIKRNTKISNTVKRSIINHHTYLKENSLETMKINAIKHRKLHSFAYNYIFAIQGKKGINKYIKWFAEKYGLKF